MTTPGSNAPVLRCDKSKALFDRLTIASFACALLAPTLDRFLRSDEKRAPTPELRRAAPPPQRPSSIQEAIEFPEKFEARWNDTFGLRDKFLRWHSIFKVLGLGVAPNSRHLIGRDHWIFIRADSAIETWRGVDPLSDYQLDSWRRGLEWRAEKCAQMGAHYLFVIAPDKPEIYPEFLPPRIQKVGPSRADQFFSYLAMHSQIDILDLRPCLIDEKKNDVPELGDFVYFPLGSHWQSRGAIRGANEILAHLEPRIPNLVPLPLAAHRVEVLEVGRDSEARNMYIDDLLSQRQYWWKPATTRHREIEQPALGRSNGWLESGGRIRIFEINDPTLPRAVIFHDSFATSFEQTVAESFSRLTMFYKIGFDVARVRAERPNLVIECYAERVLVNEAMRIPESIAK